VSHEQAKACIERLMTDQAFRDKVLGMEDVTERLQYVNAEGFACTAAEIESMSAEVTDAEATSVVGGAIYDNFRCEMGVTPRSIKNAFVGQKLR